MKGILILSIVIISTMGNPTPQPETPPTSPPVAMPTGPVAHPQTAPIEAPANHTVPGAPHNGSVPAPAEIPAPAPIEPTPVSSATVLVLHSQPTTCTLKAEYHNDHNVENVLVLSGPLGPKVISPPYSFPMFTGLTAHIFLLCNMVRVNEQVVQAANYLLWDDRALKFAAHTDQKFWAAWSSSEADELVLTSNDDKTHVVPHGGALLDATDYKQIEWKKNGNSVYKHDITQNFAQKTEWIFTYVKDGDKDNSTMTQVPWMAHTTSTVTVLHGVTADVPATATFNILHLDGTTTESAVTVAYGEAKKLSFVQGDIFVGLTIKVNDTMVAENNWKNLANMEALLPNGNDYLVGDNVTVALLGLNVDGTLLAQFIRQNSDEALASAKMSVYRFANTLADNAPVIINIASDSMPIPSQPDTFPAPTPQLVEPPKPAPMEQPKAAPMEPKAAPMEPKAAPVAPVEPKTPVPMPESPKPMAAPVEAPKPAAPVAPPTTSLFSKFFAQEIKNTPINLPTQGESKVYKFDAATFTSVKATYNIGADAKIEKDLLADAKATPQGEAQIVFFVGDSTKKDGPYVPKAVQVSEAPQPAPAPAPVESGESGFWSQPWPYIVIAAFVLVVFGGGFYFYKKQKEQTGSEGKPLLV